MRDKNMAAFLYNTTEFHFLDKTKMKLAAPILTLTLSLSPFCGFAAETDVPQSIQPPAGHKLILETQARGVQIYQCAQDAGEFKWHLKAPDAVLFDAENRSIGRHYTGPAWEYNDGSSISAKLLQKHDAAPAKALPWLLLEVAAHKGEGLLSTVRYVTRVGTDGGLTPKAPCDGNHLGSEKRIPYRARYNFYAPAPRQ